MTGISIVVNGEPRLTQSTTIEELLREFQLTGRRVAVEQNRVIVARDAFDATALVPGDHIEIVHFVGGG